MSSRLEYKPQLDGLPAVAILIVLICHWLRDAEIIDINFFWTLRS